MSGHLRPWSIRSETGTLRDVLLCRPDYYEWIPTNDIARRALVNGRAMDRGAVASQFGELEAALHQCGVSTHYLSPTPNLPYQVYTRDSSQVTPWGVVLTQLERPQRRGEVAAVLDFYAATGASIMRYATAGSLEGGDIQIIDDGLLAIGVSGGRTTEAGARQLTDWFSAQGWSTILVPFAEHFLHLDVLFCMVGEKLALGCVDVLDDGFLAWLDSKAIRVLPVSYKEAVHDMGCNVLSLGDDRVISPRHSSRINHVLRMEGMTVLDPALDVFANGGGSVHCMTMPLRRDQTSERRPIFSDQQEF